MHCSPRPTWSASAAALALAVALPVVSTALPAHAESTESIVDVKRFRIVDRESGPVNYYSVVDAPDLPFIHARYKPSWKTAVLGIQIAEADRKTARHVRWMWRATALPRGGNECASGVEDSAAVVYLTWKRGFRWYTLKYVWSGVGPKGETCARKRNPFVAQDTVILESGGALDAWRGEDIDLQGEFRRHFENGDPNAEVPDFVGIGIMTDGDQTESESGADYAQFVLAR
jgi:hypothetical protein